MVKEIKSNERGFIRECVCKGKSFIAFSSLSINHNNRRVLALPACSCGALEFLLLNTGKSEHDFMVAQIFSEVGAQ